MRLTVVGGGLAGVEAAYQMLKRGYAVDLYEMRPSKTTPAHRTGDLAELICSNSLKSEAPDTAQGALKAEMRMADSLILKAADLSRVPAGGALAVDRGLFSQSVGKLLKQFPNLAIIRDEVTEIPSEAVVAPGPLASDAIARAIAERTGKDGLHFFDAVAPIVTAESVDMRYAFYGARYGKGTPDYLNCPMSEAEYLAFREALVSAETVVLHSFEKGDVFEGCMPVEVMAKRGVDTLRFGPLRPVGIYDADGKRAYAVVQLRKEDNHDGLLNLVGFQTNLKFGEQKRVFSMIPALRDAEFVRYGVMHRNTYLDSPGFLDAAFGVIGSPTTFFAGQITGVEGYMESAMSGMIAGINLVRRLEGKPDFLPPPTTMCGSLARYVAAPNTAFQPMHVSFSLLPPLGFKAGGKAERKRAYAERAVKDFQNYIEEVQL